MNRQFGQLLQKWGKQRQQLATMQYRPKNADLVTLDFPWQAPTRNLLREESPPSKSAIYEPPEVFHNLRDM